MLRLCEDSLLAIYRETIYPWVVCLEVRGLFDLEKFPAYVEVIERRVLPTDPQTCNVTGCQDQQNRLPIQASKSEL